MRDSIYNFYLNQDGRRYIYNSKNNGIIELEEQDHNDPDVMEYLFREGYYVEDDCQEAEELIKEVNKNIRLEEEALDLTIALTNQCNFNCIYCYQDKNARLMTMETARELVSKIKDLFQKQPYKELNIHYFGGEPLLNLQVLLYLDDEFKLLSKKKKITYHSYITTNGSLLNKYLLDKIKFHSIQLTFDGFEESHNALRKSDYFGFQEQLQLIPLILSYKDTRLIIRMNACKNNQKDIIPFLEYILADYHTDQIGFNLNRMIRFHKGDKFDMLSGEEYARIDLEHRLLLKKYGREYKIPTRLFSNCKFIANNAFSITTDGKCNQCSGAGNQILEDFSKEFVKTKNELELQEECKSCKCLPLCLGGCTVQRSAGYEVCISEKYYMEQILGECIEQLA